MVPVANFILSNASAILITNQHLFIQLWWMSKLEYIRSCGTIGSGKIFIKSIFLVDSKHAYIQNHVILMNYQTLTHYTECQDEFN